MYKKKKKKVFILIKIFKTNILEQICKIFMPLGYSISTDFTSMIEKFYSTLNFLSDFVQVEMFNKEVVVKSGGFLLEGK